MILTIFSYLTRHELISSSLVNKAWQVLASDEALWNALNPEIAFGKKQWAKYFGDIGKEPPLPEDIHKILKRPCPFFPGKKVEETHMLVLIPETINGKPLNLDTLGELVKAPKEGHAPNYNSSIWTDIIKEHGHQAAAKSHWVLMKKDVIKESKNKTYKNQQALIATINNQTGLNYEVPHLLNAIVCIFMHYVSSGQRLLNAGTYTHCQERYLDYKVVVGDFSLAGLNVCVSPFIVRSKRGVMALRKLF